MKNSIENTKKAVTYLQFFVAIAIIVAIITAIVSLSMGHMSTYTTIITLKNVFIVMVSTFGIVALRELNFLKPDKAKVPDVPISVSYTVVLLFAAILSIGLMMSNETAGFSKLFPYMMGGIIILIGISTGFHLRYGIAIALFIPAVTSCYMVEPEIYLKQLGIYFVVVIVTLAIKYIFFVKWSKAVKETKTN